MITNLQKKKKKKKTQPETNKIKIILSHMHFTVGIEYIAYALRTIYNCGRVISHTTISNFIYTYTYKYV